MTPERLKEMQTVGSTSGDAGGPAPDYWRVDWVNWLRVPMLTFGELRALLAIAQRAAETCEWAKINLVHGTAFKTACGRRANHYDATLNGRPCWCGRTVAVRGGRT